MNRDHNTALVYERAMRLKAFDDANPDVGFPPMWWMFVDDALKELGLTKEDVNYEYLVK